METTPPSPRQPRQHSWLFWAVPLGCLGLVSIIVGVAMAIFFFVYGAVKSSDPYKNALAAANADARVAQVIGSPITDRLFATGNFNTSGPSGRADFALPIKGPKGKATIFAVAVKSLGEWHFEKLVVEIADTHKRIDLLQAPGSLTPVPSATPEPEQSGYH